MADTFGRIKFSVVGVLHMYGYYNDGGAWENRALSDAPPISWISNVKTDPLKL